MPIERLAWLVTVALTAITAAALLLNDYTGYGLLAIVIGAAAAINLR